MIIIQSCAYNGLMGSFQVIMLSSVTELHSYIDRTQLTRELGGTQEYNHDKWISHRTVCTLHTPAQCLAWTT